MSDERPTPTAGSAERPESPAERRRRLAAVFGDDLLPVTTSDERDPGSGTSARESGDDWLRAQVPPHHGG